MTFETIRKSRDERLSNEINAGRGQCSECRKSVPSAILIEYGAR